jgi:hypothetical protein
MGPRLIFDARLRFLREWQVKNAHRNRSGNFPFGAKLSRNDPSSFSCQVRLEINTPKQRGAPLSISSAAGS